MNYFDKAQGIQTRWASFENPEGGKGKGGISNGGAKGSAFKSLEPGEAKTLLDVTGSGIINRIWFTIPGGCVDLLREIKIKMYWDHCHVPAVSAPLGDFFCSPLNKMRAFQSELFSMPEGRSFNCFIQMPFIKGAKIVMANESDVKVSHLFYDINYQLCPLQADKILYFHSFWNRATPSLCEDYTVLPEINGCGRYLGQCFGVKTNPDYGKLWFGEGEFKVYLDGDKKFPTLCGTGIEDYIGTAWGQGEYANLTQGCTLVDGENGEYIFYRFHTLDPIYFNEGIRVTVQDIGGGSKTDVLEAMARGARLKVVSLDQGGCFEGLFEKDFVLTEESKDGWYNFYRQDEFSSCAYFYLDKPEGLNL